jgi:hypothetical protein
LVIDAGGEEVVGLLDGGEIAVEVEIDIRVRADAGATAAGGAALEAEDRAEGRLAEHGGGAFAETTDTGRTWTDIVVPDIAGWLRPRFPMGAFDDETTTLSVAPDGCVVLMNASLR